mmetsp:Transcript_9782/g.5107  ORF Transcript_9782/g.5107 Transcript_9782/m.5107 type:complete len:229 (-) Transcript_9782:2196-2882(-)
MAVEIAMNKFPSQLFITGTGTGVGKSVVAAILMTGLQGLYWKPIQSGLEEITDTQWIQKVTGLEKKHFYRETYRLKLPASPHVSAAQEGVRIELNAFKLPKTSPSQHLIIEGAGGIMVPLNEHHFMLNLMKKFNISIILVAKSTLGTINHTLLSLEQLRRHRQNILGVIMAGPINSDNRRAIEHYGKTAVIAEIEPLPALNPQTLSHSFLLNFASNRRKTTNGSKNTI